MDRNLAGNVVFIDCFEADRIDLVMVLNASVLDIDR